MNDVTAQALRDYRRIRKSLGSKKVVPVRVVDAGVVPGSPCVGQLGGRKGQVIAAAMELAVLGRPISYLQISKLTGIPLGTVKCCIHHIRKLKPSPWIWISPERVAPLRDRILELASRIPAGDILWMDELEDILIPELGCSVQSIWGAIKALKDRGQWHWHSRRHSKRRKDTK